MAIFHPARLLRRFSSRHEPPQISSSNSPPSTPASSDLPSPPSRVPPTAAGSPRGVRKVRSAPRLKKKFIATTTNIPEAENEPLESVSRLSDGEVEIKSRTTSGSETLGEERSREALVLPSEDKGPKVLTTELESDEVEIAREQPVVVVEEPTPDVADEEVVVNDSLLESAIASQSLPPEEDNGQPTTSNEGERPSTEILSPETLRKVRQHIDGPIRRPSLVDSANAKVVKTLLDSPFSRNDVPILDKPVPPKPASTEVFGPDLAEIRAMVQRKIWVKRPGASATLVQIREDDLVDDVREMILRKYANSLGKTFDAPDMTLSIASRAEHSNYRNERLLGPEEEMCRTIDSYYPGGQSVDEALIINVPQRRTPRPSPKVFAHPSYQAYDDYRPLENGTDYFPPMPAVIPASIPQTSGSHESRASQHQHAPVAATSEHPRSISVLNTGQLPSIPLPSPGVAGRRHHNRPKYHRQPTSSPNILAHPTGGAAVMNAAARENPPGHMVHRASTRPRMDSSAAMDAHAANGIAAAPAPLPTPPAQESSIAKNNSNPPTPSAATGQSHRPGARPRKSRKPTPEDRAASSNRNKSSPSGPSLNNPLANAAVPPISVLIVEDNIINLRILEGLMKRLKVRWQTAMNGQIAVDKWRGGGFHLVLMDIQMPIMNGLQAAREIRRLERVNGIGVFGELESPLSRQGSKPETNGGGTSNKNGDSSTNSNDANEEKSKNTSDDKLQISEGLFKSPVIIVALTASSLQSDRHEALAAGCNDFLNKPVNLVWLERKVKEWGCMQALIDYDGWRAWKDYAAEQEAGKTEEERQKEREKEEKAKIKAEKMAKLQEKQAQRKKEEEEGKKKRESLNSAGGGSVGEGGDGVNEATAALKSGAEFLKEANLSLE